MNILHKYFYVCLAQLAIGPVSYTGAANLNSLPHSLVPESSCLVILSPDSRLSWTDEVGEKLSRAGQLNPHHVSLACGQVGFGLGLGSGDINSVLGLLLLVPLSLLLLGPPLGGGDVLPHPVALLRVLLGLLLLAPHSLLAAVSPLLVQVVLC